MRDEKAARSRMEAALIRIETMLTTTLPHLATKADVADLRAESKAGIADLRAETKADNADLKADIARLDADKPGKAYMWGVLAVLLTAYGCGLAALAVLK